MTPEIRLENLKKFINELEEQGKAKSFAEIARIYDGVDASYLSQLVNGYRNLGEKAARNLEKKFQLPDFYFDRQPEVVMSGITERIVKKATELGLNQTDIINGSGAGKSTVHKWFNHLNDPSAKYLDNLAKTLNTTTGWLLTGTGQERNIRPTDGIPLSEFKARGITEWDNDTPLEDDEFELPYYKDVELKGGDGSFEIAWDDGRRRLRYAKSTARQSGASMTQSFCTTLTGDSMEERIQEGAMIAIDATKKEIREGKIYAFRHGQLYRVKYLIPRPDGGLLIRSHNPSYADEIVKPEDMDNIEILGWVWNWSTLERW